MSGRRRRKKARPGKYRIPPPDAEDQPEPTERHRTTPDRAAHDDALAAEVAETLPVVRRRARVRLLRGIVLLALCTLLLVLTAAGSIQDVQRRTDARLNGEAIEGQVISRSCERRRDGCKTTVLARMPNGQVQSITVTMADPVVGRTARLRYLAGPPVVIVEDTPEPQGTPIELRLLVFAGVLLGFLSASWRSWVRPWRLVLGAIRRGDPIVRVQVRPGARPWRSTIRPVEVRRPNSRWVHGVGSVHGRRLATDQSHPALGLQVGVDDTTWVAVTDRSVVIVSRAVAADQG